MYSFLLWNNYCDKKVKNKHLFFSLVFVRIEGNRMRAKDQKQTIYFKRPKIASKPLSCINTIGLITLQYIYASRCLKKFPSFAQLKSKILDVQNIEKYIAIKNNRLKKHEIKWKGF